MNYLVQKYKGRIINVDNRWLVYINKDNFYFYNKASNDVEWVVKKDSLKEHLLDMFNNSFNCNVVKFTEWILQEYSFDDDVEGFVNDDVEEEVVGTNRDYLYLDLLKTVNKDRVLKIYSFGKKHRKCCPDNSVEATFNACILSGKKKGLNLKKMNGYTHVEVQKSVETSKNFDQFMTMMVEKIEAKDLHCIAVYCSAGRHRSVTCCEILKKRLYPKSSVFHIELKKHS